MNALPGIRARLTGAALRRYRESPGRTLDDAARILGCDPSGISRTETGQRGMRPADISTLLAEYGATGTGQDAFEDVFTPKGRQARYTTILPGTYLCYPSLETRASRIIVYEAQRIPVLLQTPAYATAPAMASEGSAADTGDTAQSALLDRQEAILGNDSADIHVITGQAALRQRTGGQDVTDEQLERLGQAASRVTVQILPFSAGAHPALHAGSLTMLRFDGVPGLPGVVYLETPDDGLLLDSEDDLKSCARIFSSLKTPVLDYVEWRRLLPA